MAQSIENTGFFSGLDVRNWLKANRKMVAWMESWCWENAKLAMEWGEPVCELLDPAGERYAVSEVSSLPGAAEAIGEALCYFQAQAETMARLHAALPELEGCEGIEVHTMDSLLGKLTGQTVDPAEVFGGLQGDWTDEDAEVVLNCAGLSSAPEVDEVALMAEARAEGAEFLGETDLSDALVDFLNARAPKMGDDALLRILARAVGHHMAERNMRETESLCWVMREAGDGYELTLKDGSEFSFLVRR